MMSRRTIMAAALGGLGAEKAMAMQTQSPVQKRTGSDFLWGTAISAHQSEGSNTNSDTWLLENLTPTLYKDRSGDACDSYNRYEEDIALNAALGFNCYRFGIEWARIEPSQGRFSNAQLDHYARVLEACRKHGQTPIVTFNHFSVPRWFAERGGFEVPDAADIFARYCGRATEHLGDMIGMATTFNEANIQLLLQVSRPNMKISEAAAPMIAAARRATGSSHFSTMAFADPEISQPIMLDAHRKAYRAMKAARPGLQVGMSLTSQDVQSDDPEIADQRRADLYGGWIEATRNSADFVGVQTYTRMRFDAKGILRPPPGAEMTAAGYEFYPQALPATIRWAHRTFPGKPIYVTESGIGTDDDARRIAFIDQALEGVRACVDEGIAVHSYLYWSLLDNFEWTSGYGKHFGLVAVDLETFKRTPKPSAYHLGRRAKLGLL